MADSPYLEQYKIFMLKARQDIDLVHEVVGNGNVAPEIIFFHLQQSVEKLIKSLFTFHSVMFPKTHDLESLADLAVKHGILLPSFIDRLFDLSPYAVDGRYAIIHDDVHDITIILEQVKQFYSFVQDATGTVEV